MREIYKLLIFAYIGLLSNSLHSYPTYVEYEFGTSIPSFIWSETSILFYDSSDPVYDSYFYTPQIGWLYSDINDSAWYSIGVNQSVEESDEFLAMSPDSSGTWAFSWDHGWMFFEGSKWITYTYGKSYFEKLYSITKTDVNFSNSYILIYVLNTDDWVLTSESFAPWAWSYNLNEWIQL